MRKPGSHRTSPAPVTVIAAISTDDDATRNAIATRSSGAASVSMTSLTGAGELGGLGSGSLDGDGEAEAPGGTDSTGPWDGVAAHALRSNSPSPAGARRLARTSEW